MTILVIIAGLLLLWWFFFTIFAARQMLHARAEASHLRVTAAEMEQYRVSTPRFPSWSDYLARPALFLIIPYVVVLHSIVFILLWPGIPLSCFFCPDPRRKNEHQII